MTSGDIGYQPKVLEQKKFDYSPLGKIFNKGLDKDDKEERLFKRLKNIEGKNKELLDEIKDQKQRNQVKWLRLKILCFMIQITIFTNTKYLNFLGYCQLNLNLMSLSQFTKCLFKHLDVKKKKLLKSLMY